MAFNRWRGWIAIPVAAMLAGISFQRYRLLRSEKQLERGTQAFSSQHFDDEMRRRLNVKYDVVSPEARVTDVGELLQIHSIKALLEKRKDLIRFVWATGEVPTAREPDQITSNIQETRFSADQRISQVDRLTIRMPHGLESRVFHLHPARASRKAIVYHAGHGDPWNSVAPIVDFFLDRGYHVFWISMPLVGENQAAVVTVPSFGTIRLYSHEQLQMLDHPFQYFFDPLAAVVNYGQRQQLDIQALIGLSGGAWTVTLYAAMDPRVPRVYPVAGSLPQYLWDDQLNNLWTAA